MVSTKHAFWWALIFTILIFTIGIILGFVLENNRSDKVQLAMINSEINLLDQQVRTRTIGEFNINCEQSKSSAFTFADKIYEEASQLELFDSSAKFTSDLRTLHKRYDLLRIILWMEAISTKEECNNFHTIVYLFEYAPEDTQKKAVQASTSRLLLDIKKAHENEILLIPIAGNLDIESVNLIKEKYGISEMPAIIVDEKTLISEKTTFEELENKIFNSTEEKPSSRFDLP